MKALRSFETLVCTYPESRPNISEALNPLMIPSYTKNLGNSDGNMKFDFIAVMNVRIVLLLHVTYQTALRHIQGGRYDDLSSYWCSLVWQTFPSLKVVVSKRLQIPEHLHVVILCAEHSDGLNFYTICRHRNNIKRCQMVFRLWEVCHTPCACKLMVLSGSQ